MTRLTTFVALFLAACTEAQPAPSETESEDRTYACIEAGGDPDQCTFEEMKRVMRK